MASKAKQKGNVCMQVYSMAGNLLVELMTYSAARVRDLKIEIHRTLDMPISSFRLLHGTDDLQDICLLGECFEQSVLQQAERGESISLTLVRLSSLHAEWLNRWYEITPSWLTTAGCLRVIQQDEFRALGLKPKPAEASGRGSQVDEKRDMSQTWTCRRFMRYVPHLLDAGNLRLMEVGNGWLQFKHAQITVNILRSDILAAIDEIPALLEICEGHVGHSLALDALQKDEGLFRHLPESLKEDKWFLYELFLQAPSMREEFLQTAGKGAVNAFLWYEQEVATDEVCCRRNRRRGSKRR
mmetsp:Transcript_41220/g.94814  ORF Transcript_41220/g.94814 Transcript_41220/m.94814 type:complete len:298 (+) Transcript_41220:37-930(+)